MTAATLGSQVTPAREVTWRQMGVLLEENDLQPGYSQSTGRAYVAHDQVLIWANVGRAALDPQITGAGRIQAARVASYLDVVGEQYTAWLGGLTPVERGRVEAEAHRIATLPDPPQHQIDAYCERHGLREFQ